MNDQKMNSNQTTGNNAAFSPPGKAGGNRFLYIVVIVAVVAACIWAFSGKDGDEAVVDMGSTFTVERGDLLISIIEGGNLKAQKSVQIECEVEGKATIVTLIPEGTYVKEGDLLVELDSSDLEERFTQQEISYENAKAAMIQAEENQKIQVSQNKSNIMEGELDVEFAQLELEKFLGRKEGNVGVEFDRVELQRLLNPVKSAMQDEKQNKGSLELDRQQLENDIKIADAEYLRAKDRLDWTRKLTEKGFVNNDELKADELTLEQRKINLDDAEQQKYLSETYDFPMQLKRLIADLEQAQLGLERIRSRADAEMAQKEADVRSKNAQFKLQEERFNKLKEQLERCTIKAPQDGLVVYGQQDGGRHRWGGSDNDIIEEGASVRYRQTLITLPDVSVMILDTKVHESAIDKVDVGMHCVIEVDAFPDKQFHGKVSKVAILPDSQSRWLNPDLKVYSTDVTLEDGSEKLKPGMSAKVEIMIDRIEDVLYVPIQSVFRRGGREVCYLLSPAGSIDIRTVQPGQTNEQFVSIESGLEKGERVLLYAPPVSDEIADDEEVQGDGPRDFPTRKDLGGDEEGSERRRASSEMAGEGGDRGERGGMPEISQEQREKFKKMMELPEDERRKMFEKMREEGGFPSGGGDWGGGRSREGASEDRRDREGRNRGGEPAPERGEETPVQAD